MRYITLTRGKRAMVDDEDYEYLSQWKWYALEQRRVNEWYAVRGMWISKMKKNTTVRMQRIIMDCPKGMVVDHINHNTLDNRKGNLRICTNQENLMNMKSHRDSKSKFKGVSWFEYTKKWVAFIRANNKNYNLGYFDKEEDAAIVYDTAAQLFFGEYASTNF